MHCLLHSSAKHDNYAYAQSYQDNLTIVMNALATHGDYSIIRDCTLSILFGCNVTVSMAATCNSIPCNQQHKLTIITVAQCSFLNLVLMIRTALFSFILDLFHPCLQRAFKCCNLSVLCSYVMLAFITSISYVITRGNPGSAPVARNQQILPCKQCVRLSLVLQTGIDMLPCTLVKQYL